MGGTVKIIPIEHFLCLVRFHASPADFLVYSLHRPRNAGASVGPCFQLEKLRTVELSNLLILLKMQKCVQKICNVHTPAPRPSTALGRPLEGGR